MTENTPSPDPVDQKITYLVTLTRDLAAPLLRPATLGSLDKLAARTQRPTVQAIVAGEVSRGKSTLINALIGHPILPDAASALTSTWTVVQHGPQLMAEATIITPQGLEQHQLAGQEDIDRYMTVAGERVVRKRHGSAARVASVLLRVPAPVLEGGLGLIDTPGVGGLAAAHRYATLAALDEADALLFVIKPGEPISATERKFLAEAARHLETCVIVQAQRDLVPEPDAWLAEDMATLRDAGKWAELLPDRATAERLSAQFTATKSVSVSALNALNALSGASEPADPVRTRLYENSGLPLLTEILEQVVASGYSLHRRNVLRLIESIVTECQDRLRERIMMLTESGASSRLTEERKERVMKWLEHGGAYWRPVLDSTYRDLTEEIRALAARRATEISTDCRRRFPDLSASQLVAETQGLLTVPDAVLAQLNQLGKNAMSDAVEGVRELLVKDELGGPLTMLGQTTAVFNRLPDSFERIPGGRDLNDLRAVLAGGGAVAGVAGLWAAAMSNAGYAAAAPIIVPFIIGAGAYLYINRKTREQKRTLQGALETLTVVCDEIKTTAVTTVLTAAESTRNALADVVMTGLHDLQAQVEQDIEDLRQTEGLSAEQRRAELADLEQALRNADVILQTLSSVRGQL
jgi:hypothetical protein